MKKFPSLIGVIHLPPLAGSPWAPEGAHLALQGAGYQALKETKIFTQAGFDGVILENFGDSPFFKGRVPPETVSSISVIAGAVREATRIPVGINVLRNDAFSALAIAAVTGCNLIRVNVLSGVAAADQGLIEGEAAALLRERRRLSSDVAVFADVHVKHARTLSSEDPILALEETVLRAKADAAIVTGSTTGRNVDFQVLKKVGAAAKELKVPLYVGSGVSLETLGEVKKHVTGVIVSSSLRRGGQAGMPLDAKRVRAFAKEFKKRR